MIALIALPLVTGTVVIGVVSGSLVLAVVFAAFLAASVGFGAFAYFRWMDPGYRARQRK
jgi:hypothetical protein